MKSLHLIGSAEMGGAERWFKRFLEAMVRAGEDVHAVVRRDSDLARHHLGGIAHSELGFRTVWDPLSKWEVARLVARSDAPIVQTYMGRATRLLHLPPKGRQVHVSRLGGYYKLDPFVHAHAWIGNTKGLCDWMIAGGLPAERVHHVTNFADPVKPCSSEALAALRTELAVQDEDLLIVTAGRLIDVKGQRYLLDAFARLPERLAGRRLRLVVLGDGPLAEPLQAQARQLGVAARVHWAGWQQDPTPWFHLADLIAFPSRDPETLGNVILEAWSYGKPLVATAFRGARELTRHGEDAWVVPCDDGAALAEGLRTVVPDAQLQASMVRQGLQRIEHEFSEAAVIGAYRELYARLLRER